MSETNSSVPSQQTSPTEELWQCYHSNCDTHTENALVQNYLPIVRSVLGRLAMTLPDHVDEDDLNSAGVVGLLQAIRNYNPSCGASFESYARLLIRGAMLGELRRMDWVPRTIHEKARKIQDALQKLQDKLGRTPTDYEMAKELKLTIMEYGELLEEIRPASFVCLDGNYLQEAKGLNESADDGNPVDDISKCELKKVILAGLKELPETQRKVLVLYYGEDLRLKDIAEVFGVTESRICQIHASAILAIRAYLQKYEAERAKH